ncbi:hypothetical protein K2173_006916 [Erythroxylum novogranatense]|uniref:RRM domain-containing protein n=1 Tax=Erythroxylum novogranatense TaxID=1862640 RepID=A0AAV8SY35_9ROSI|nr:hypothetical protein K2173_006916 [Erythroxylum novogranatense]
MPSKVMDFNGTFSSSSFISEDVPFSTKVGFWNSDTVPDHRAIIKPAASSSLEKLVSVDCDLGKSIERSQPIVAFDQKTNHPEMGAKTSMGQSTLIRPMDHDSLDLQATSYFSGSGKVNIMATENENSLFSSSLSELFNRKLTISSNAAPYGHSVRTIASTFEEEVSFESLEEIEAQTVGNLLPTDEELFADVNDGLGFNPPSVAVGDDVEDLDFFSSVGGMDLGDDGSASQNDSDFSRVVTHGQLRSNTLISEQHPFGEHPSRTLFVRNIHSHVEDSELRNLLRCLFLHLMQYGDIRRLHTACKSRGFVIIHYYDIRAARKAMKELQNRPLRHKNLDVHYSIPEDNPSEKDINQGTLVIFSLDSTISNDRLRKIFGIFGEIMEIRESPNRNDDKLIEFYDSRSAEAALHSLNGSELDGKHIKLEPYRMRGSKRSLMQQIMPLKLEQDDYGTYMLETSPSNNRAMRFSGRLNVSNSMCNGTILGATSVMQTQYLESDFHHGISSSVPNSFSSLLGIESAGNCTGFAEASHSNGQFNFDVQCTRKFHPHSLPEYHNDLNRGAACDSHGAMPANINFSPHERISNKQSFRVGKHGQLVEFNDIVFGSPVNDTSVLGRHYTWGNSYHSQSSSMMWPNSPSFVNGISMAHATPTLHGPPRGPPPMMNPVLPLNNHYVGSAPTVTSIWDRQYAYVGESPENSGFHPGSFESMRIPSNSLLAHKIMRPQVHPQRSLVFPAPVQMFPMVNSFDSTIEHPRSRRNEGTINQTDKKQYELDIDRIMRGEDNRTTLMIKNIPNKYTSKMLLAAIDEGHKGTYNFIYLPIDFKNKCNVGYAFINMIDPSHIIPFYQAFNGKKWEKFNSEKVASLAYARIQGKAALVAHFQNSSLMNEDKRCRPILFNTDGPNAGDQVPFPVGANVRSRPVKPRSSTYDTNQQGSSPNLGNMVDTPVEDNSFKF